MGHVWRQGSTHNISKVTVVIATALSWYEWPCLKAGIHICQWQIHGHHSNIVTLLSFHHRRSECVPMDASHVMVQILYICLCTYCEYCTYCIWKCILLNCPDFIGVYRGFVLDWLGAFPSLTLIYSDEFVSHYHQFYFLCMEGSVSGAIWTSVSEGIREGHQSNTCTHIWGGSWNVGKY